MSSSYPYATTHDVIRGLPSEGRSRASILQELEGFAKSEDQSWETGKVSGTMYCGDHEHYELLGRAFEGGRDAIAGSSDVVVAVHPAQLLA